MSSKQSRSSVRLAAPGPCRAGGREHLSGPYYSPVGETRRQILSGTQGPTLRMPLLRRLIPLLVAAPVALAACSDSVSVPAGTRLLVEMETRIHPDSVAEGDAVITRLAGDLEGRDGVLIREGATIEGRITAIQEARGQWPHVVKIAFDSIRIRGMARPISADIASATPRTPEGVTVTDTDLIGSVVSGRAGAALIRGDIADAPGTGVALATGAKSAPFLPGSRMELELTAELQVPRPGG